MIKNIFHIKNRDTLTVILFLAPSLTGFAIFFLFPFLAGIYYSLVDSPISGNFVGLFNYMKLLANPIFLRAAGNTMIFKTSNTQFNFYHKT